MDTPDGTRTKDRQRAYAAGYDAGVNGPNTTNCHFGWFCERAMTTAWEDGKRAGDAAKAQRKDPHHG